MALYTIPTDSSGAGLWVPPYTLADGVYSVRGRSVYGGPSGPLGPGISLTMPNAAKTATLALISRMAVAPSAARAEAMYALISALMSAGVWSKLDTFYVLGAHSAQAAGLNWVNASYELSPVSGPTFTIDRGYRGDGAVAYLNATGYNPAAASLNLQLNSASAGVWVLTPSTVGGLDLFLETGRMGRRNNANGDYAYRLNDGTTVYGTAGDTPGLVSMSRADSTTKRFYKNGSLNKTDTATSITVANRLVLLNAVATLYSNAEISAAFTGSNITDAQHFAVYTALRSHLIYLGAISS